MISFDAVVLAGGKMESDDPLFHETSDGSRCMIDILGKPMVQWVIDALDESPHVANLYVIGLPPESGLQANKPLHFLEDHGDMVDNIRFGVKQSASDHPERSKALIVSGDIPGIQPHMVAWLAEQVTADPSRLMYYNVISQQTMKARFPDAKRSFVRFKDISVCGGDLNAVDKNLFASEHPLWEKLTHARKHPLRQAGLIGFDTLLLVIFRVVTLQAAVEKVCQRLHLNATALLCPYAEMGMDADKPHQLAILRQHLEERA